MNPELNLEFVLAQLFDAFPSNKATQGTVAVYTRRLREIPPEILQTVVDQCIDECKFLPTVGEVLDRYRAMTAPPVLDEADAWGMVQKKIQDVGHWHKGTPDFDDPLVAKVVGAMGWRELCMSENAMVDRAHFRNMYNQLVQRTEQERKLSPETRQLMARYALERQEQARIEAEENRSDGVVGDLKRLGLVDDTFELRRLDGDDIL